MLMPFNVGDTVAFITEGNQKFTVTEFVSKPEYESWVTRGADVYEAQSITVERFNVGIITYVSDTPVCNIRPSTPNIITWCVDARALKLVKRFDVNDMNISDGGNNG